MNSSKRGAVYGFKLQSLDLVSWRGQQVQEAGNTSVRARVLSSALPPLPSSCWTRSPLTGR